MKLTSFTWPRSVYVLIPSYKGAGQLQPLLEKLTKIAGVGKICIVNDGPDSATEEVCRQFDVHCITHPVNRGKGSALRTGFKYLMEKCASWVITMDADGQHAPEDLEKFIQAILHNHRAGIIIGARDMRMGHMPFFRILSNRITSGILSMMTGTKIIDSQCGYRAYSSRLLGKINIEYSRFEMESEVIMKAVRLGFQVNFIQVQTLYLKGGSHIAHIADTFRWIRAVLRIRAGKH